ncbi:MAG: hypothetical protein WCV80_04065 [Candidatus Paceibacterota bacterium]|jgi:hypothetical protein
MIFVIATVVIFFGVIIFSFVASNIILILFFAIPFTKKLEGKNLLKPNNHIIRNYIVTLFIQLVVFFVITTPFYIYFLDSAFISLVVGYMFGMVGIIIKIKEFGLNLNNFSDYFETNSRYFWEELIIKYNEDKNKIFDFVTAILKDNKQQ